MKRSRWLLGLAAIAVLAIAFALGRSGSTPGVSRSRGESAASPTTFVAHDVVVRQTGDDGQLQYRLEAARVEQKAQDKQLAATELAVHYEASDAASRPIAGSQWKLTADRAALPSDGDLLQLRGAVRVTGQPPSAAAPVTMATESLDYSLRTQEITTVDAVELRMGPQLLQGRGLRANIRLGTLQLESDVHGDLAR